MCMIYIFNNLSVENFKKNSILIEKFLAILKFRNNKYDHCFVSF